MSDRLNENWCLFLNHQASAQKHNIAKLSTAPCSPAPSRCLLIMRDDTQRAPSGMFLTFEDILSSTANSEVDPYRKQSSREFLPGYVSEPLRYQASMSKTRWNFLKSVMSFGSANEGTSKEASPCVKNLPGVKHRENRYVPKKVYPTNSPNAIPDAMERPRGASGAQHATLSFKFSLEWVDHSDSSMIQDRHLYPPKMPFPALLSRKPALLYDKGGYVGRDLEGPASGPSKYAGRALAEWAILIDECQKFFDRRKAEGVPSFHQVETPMLSVDPFRKV